MKKQHVTLTNDHRTYLHNLIKKGSLPAKTYKRALALLELDRGRTFTEVAKIVGAVHQTDSFALFVLMASKAYDNEVNLI